VDAAIGRALEKLPADRFAATQDFAKALADPGFRHGELAGTRTGEGVGRWNFLTIGLAFTTIAFGALAGWSLLRPQPPQPVERFASPFLPGQEFVNQFDISDDGSMLVYGGPGDQLWVRRWRDLQASPIPGTRGASAFTVSPDGTRIALQSGPNVSVLSLSGGAPRALMRGRLPFWAVDDYVYVSVSGEGVVRVRAGGGSPEPVTLLGQGHISHTVSDVLPGGGGALINVRKGSQGSEVHVVDLETGAMKLLTSGYGGSYASTGHLVFQVEAGDLMAVRFDPDAMEIMGEAIPVVEGAFGARLSQSGTLVYLDVGEGAGQDEFVWVTRSGQQEPLGWPFRRGAQSRGWSLSPDDTRLAFTADETEPGSQNIWIKELPDGPMILLADEEGQAWNPRWRSDGQALTYSLGETGSRAVLSRRADGTGVPQLLFDGSLDAPGALLNPDEDWLVLRVGYQRGLNRTIMAMQPGVDSVPLPLLDDGYNADHPTLSPDGRWLAYTSDESGRLEVYVRPFPDTDASRTQVSTDGGLQPLWANNGRELFFVSANREMWSAQYETTSGFRVVGRELLFEIPTGIVNTTNRRVRYYDVSSDDQRFLMLHRYGTAAEGGFTGVVLVQNWTEELKQLVPN
jgi:serine/threonine-protein kinase